MQKRKDKINRKKYHSILVIAAIAIVVLLDAGMILMPDHTSSDMENRTLQTFPKLTFSTLVSGKFESEFETYTAHQMAYGNSGSDNRPLQEKCRWIQFFPSCVKLWIQA